MLGLGCGSLAHHRSLVAVSGWKDLSRTSRKHEVGSLEANHGSIRDSAWWPACCFFGFCEGAYGYASTSA